MGAPEIVKILRKIFQFSFSLLSEIAKKGIKSKRHLWRWNQQLFDIFAQNNTEMIFHK